MPDGNSSATYHLSELDFDISKIPNQLQDIDNLISQYVQNYQNQFSNIHFGFDTQGVQGSMQSIQRVFKDAVNDITDSQAIVSTVFSKEEIDAAKERLLGLLSATGKVSRLKIFTDDDNRALKAVVKTVDDFGQSVTETFSLQDRAVGEAVKGVQEYERVWAKTKSVVTEDYSMLLPTVQTTWLDKMKSALSFELVNAAEDAVRFTVETLKEVEYEVMEITRVLGDATLNTKEYTQSLFDIATEYGRQFSDVTEVTLRFAQAGFDASESMEMTRTTMLALNTAELNVEQATNSLIGIMKQWSMMPKDFSLIIDKINLAADSFAITSQDLVDGLLRSSSAAANAKFTFDETIGALTAMKETSGRTGKEVGTALNSLITYTQRAKSLAVFEDLGVKVYADETKETLMPVLSIWEKLSDLVNENGDAVVTTLEKYTDMSNLMSEEVAAATGTLDEYNQALEAQQSLTKEGLTDMERQAIYEQAGTHRRNYFIALLKNFGRVQQVVTELEDAEGHSMRENAKYMDTLTARYNQFITTLQGLAQAVGDSGFIGLAKDILSIGTALVELGSKAASIETLTFAATALFGVLKKDGKLTETVFKTSIKTWDDFLNVFDRGADKTAGFVQSIMQMNFAQIKAQASSVALKLSTLALNAAMAAGVAVAIEFAIKGLAYLANYSENVRKDFDELTAKLQDTNREFQNSASTVEKVKKEYAELAQGVGRFGENLSLSNDDYENYLEYSNKLAEIFPGLVIGTDEQGNAILNLNGEYEDIIQTIDRYIEVLKESKNQEILEGSEEAFSLYKKSAKDAQNEIDRLVEKQERLKEFRKTIEGYQDELHSAGPALDRYTARLEELGVQYNIAKEETKSGIRYRVVVDEDSIEIANNRIAMEIEKQQREIELSYSRLKPIINAKIETELDAAEIDDENIESLFKNIASKMTFSTEAEMNDWVERMAIKFREATPEMQKAIDDLFSLESAVKTGEISVEDYKESIAQALSSLKGLIPEDLFQSILDEYVSVSKSMEVAAADGVRTLKDIAIEQISDIEEAIKSLNSEIDTVQSSFQTLADVVGEYNTQGYVSIETLQKLIQLSPSYLALLSEENGSLIYNEDAYRRVIAAEIEKMRVDTLNNIARQISDIDSESAALGILEGEYLAAASGAENLTQAIISNIAALEEQGTVSAGTAQKLLEYIETVNAVFDKAKENEGNYTPPEYKAPTISSGGSGKSWYDSQAEAFERLNRMGQKNTQQVVDFYRQMTKSANVSAADRIKAEEKLFDAIKDQIQESLKAQIDALNKQKEAIEKNADAQVDNLNDRKKQIEDEAQAEIDAIQKVQDERDRQRDYEEYQRKLAEAKLDLASAQRRSGIDARRAEAEALDKLDEINRDWQEKVEDWAIEDRIAEIEAYRDAEIASIEAQIEAIQEQKEADIAAIDETIDHLNEQFSEANINMMAYASMTSEQLYNQYVGEFIEPMANGLFDGFLQANNLMESAAVGNAGNLANIYRSQFINPMREEIASLQAQAESIKLGPYLSDTYQLKSLPTAEFARRQESRTYNVNMTNNNNVSNQADINRMTKGILRAIGSAITGQP